MNVFRIKGIALFLLLFSNNISAKDIAISLGGNYESDQVLKEENLYLELDYLNSAGNMHHMLNFDFDVTKELENNEFRKTEERTDFEYLYNYLKNDYLYGIYFRYKDDQFQSSTEQNYKILTVGYGKEFKKDDQRLTFELFVGGRRASGDEIFIYRPSITYDKSFEHFDIEYDMSFLQGDDFEIFQSNFEFIVPVQENLSFKIISEYEKTDIDGEEEYERGNKFALSYKINL